MQTISQNDKKKFYYFFGRFPQEFREKIDFISKRTYLPKISIFKKMIDQEYNELKGMEVN